MCPSTRIPPSWEAVNFNVRTPYFKRMVVDLPFFWLLSVVVKTSSASPEPMVSATCNQPVVSAISTFQAILVWIFRVSVATFFVKFKVFLPSVTSNTIGSWRTDRRTTLSPQVTFTAVPLSYMSSDGLTRMINFSSASPCFSSTVHQSAILSAFQPEPAVTSMTTVSPAALNKRLSSENCKNPFTVSSSHPDNTGHSNIHPMITIPYNRCNNFVSILFSGFYIIFPLFQTFIHPFDQLFDRYISPWSIHYFALRI